MLAVALALLGACGGSGTENTVPAGEPASARVATSVATSERLGEAGSEDVTGHAMVGGGSMIDGLPHDATDTDERTEPDLLATPFEEATEEPETVEDPDGLLGGAPDDIAVSMIRTRLEAAGVDMSGITVSVLPVSGMDGSLLLFEVGDEYLESALITDEEGEDMTAELLTLAEIETARVAKVVTVYRRVDEGGSFSMSFAVSLDAFREAHETNGDLGGELRVQLDRGS